MIARKNTRGTKRSARQIDGRSCGLENASRKRDGNTAILRKIRKHYIDFIGEEARREENNDWHGKVRELENTVERALMLERKAIMIKTAIQLGAPSERVGRS